MKFTPAGRGAYQLMHDGSLALARVEANGIRVDTAYLERTIADIGSRIQTLEGKLQTHPDARTWRRVNGDRTNFGSRAQLGHLVFEVLGHPCKSRTATGKPSTEAEAFEGLDIPIVKLFQQIDKLRVSRSTYLMGIQREVCRGYLHPSFNLHLTQTYRSSCDKPNFQNIPIRDPEVAKLIRQCFIPRPGHCMVEVDYAAIEVRIATCYHRDPTMVKYIKDNYDLHAEMASVCYKLDLPDVTKMARYCAKNMFVFPQFYGDYYVHCARSMWEAIDKHNLTTAAGVPLKEHLRKKGITSLGACDPDMEPIPGTFEYHIRAVEKHFWNTRFPVYASWKKTWYQSYLNRGYFDTLTGFHIEGVYGRNDVINYPVQGSAFHCLLWSLIRIQRECLKRGLRVYIVGQIHDSIVADVHEDDVQEYLTICQRVMTQDIAKAWDWLIVPLEVEAEVAPVGRSWFHKEKVAIAV